MLGYALEYEIVDKNYARTFDISSDILKEQESMRRAHIPFTEVEMEKLWNNVDAVNYVDILLIQCYTGWRPQELRLIRIENVDLEKRIMTGGIKTKAGTNRVVPIHSKIFNLVERRYKEALSINSNRLLNCTDTATHKSNPYLTYDKYRHRVENIIKKLGLNPEHRAHDGRVQFVTLAKKYNVDGYAIKYIVGHSISDIPEKIYTHRNSDWLKSEIEKIK